MNGKSGNQVNQNTATNNPLSRGILQRQCATCEQHTIAGAECEECQKNNSSLQHHSSSSTMSLAKSQSKTGLTNNSAEEFLQPSDFNHDFTQIPMTRMKSSIQAKLTMSQPGDKYEQEADAMAENIVQNLNNAPSSQISQQQQKLQKKEVTSEFQLVNQPIVATNIESVSNYIQTQNEQQNNFVPASVEHRLNTTKGSGTPLPADTRIQMESVFGADFSTVRLHTDKNAIQLNQDLNAQAFTHGTDIYFNAGKYDNNSQEGKKLLAHELTHTVQQTGGNTSLKIGKKDKTIQRSVSTLCNAPSSWGMPPSMWLMLGEFAHLIGRGDYLTKMGGTRGLDVYFDTFELLPIDPDYAAFIIRNNPSLSAWQQVFLSITPLKRPDYMVHRPGLTEFDELKPDSIPGVLDGVSKIYEIAGYMSLLGLPYRFGTTYTPTRMIPLFTTSLGGVPVEVALKFERKRSGLIVYELCITTDWALVAKAALIALIVAILIILLRRLPIPGPTPVPAPALAEIGEPDFTPSSALTQLG